MHLVDTVASKESRERDGEGQRSVASAVFLTAKLSPSRFLERYGICI